MEIKSNNKETGKKRSPYDIPSDDEEEEIEEVVDVSLDILVKKKEASRIVYIDDSGSNEKIIFLRKFLGIFITQYLFITMMVSITFFLPWATALSMNIWIPIMGVVMYLLLIIPILFNLSKYFYISCTLMIMTDVGLSFIFSYISVVIGSSIGFLCFLLIIFALLSLLVYSLIITEEYNWLHAFLISTALPTIVAGVMIGYYLADLWKIVISLVFVIVMMLTICYASQLHITDWAKGHEANEYYNPATKLHYDFINIIINLLNKVKTKPSSDKPATMDYDTI